MNVHKNARLTPHGREHIARQVLSGQRPKAVAQAAGVCPRTIRKWVDRYRVEGLVGLNDRSSRPHRLYRPTPQAVVEQVEVLRRARRTGKQIAAELDLSPATVSRILKRLGLNRIDALEPTKPVHRYERARPGEMIHIDIKKLGRFKTVGHRISGDPSPPFKSRGAGWEFVHVAIDDHSRVAFAKVMANERKGCATAFLKAALGYYESLGIKVERVMTDNGSATGPLRSAGPAGGSASNTSGPRLTVRKPTARPSASSRPRCASGPTRTPIKAHGSAAPSFPSGSIDTIGIGLTQVSMIQLPSADLVCRRTTC